MYFDINYLSLLIGLYIILLNKPLPKSVEQIFSNVLFKIILLLTIIILSFKNPTISILLTIAYVITLQYTGSESKISENFAVPTCIPGQRRNNGRCEQCPIGYISDDIYSCKKCPSGQSTNSDNTKCIDCLLGQIISKNNRCINCPPGQILDGAKCINCPVGQISDGKTCTSCGSNTFSDASRTKCVSTCPPNEILNISGNSCLYTCPVNGKEALNLLRNQCVDSKSCLLNSPDNTKCIYDCPEGQYINPNNECV